MAILNYTTKVDSLKTASEIQNMLMKAKAQAIMIEQDSEGLTAISFRIRTASGIMSFRLPANAQKVYQVLVRNPRLHAKAKTHKQAANVAWRITKDWLAVQLAIIEAGIVDLEQVFLPYAQNEQGVTVYEALKEKKFSGLALMDQK